MFKNRGKIPSNQQCSVLVAVLNRKPQYCFDEDNSETMSQTGKKRIQLMSYLLISEQQTANIRYDSDTTYKGIKHFSL